MKPWCQRFTRESIPATISVGFCSADLPPSKRYGPVTVKVTTISCYNILPFDNETWQRTPFRTYRLASHSDFRLYWCFFHSFHIYRSLQIYIVPMFNREPPKFWGRRIHEVFPGFYISISSGDFQLPTVQLIPVAGVGPCQQGTGIQAPMGIDVMHLGRFKTLCGSRNGRYSSRNR